MNKFEKAKTLKVIETTFLSKYKRNWGCQEKNDLMNVLGSNQTMGSKGGYQIMHL
jgi:hypothetical protein